MRHIVRIALLAICSFFAASCCFDLEGTPNRDGIRLRISDAATGTGIRTDTLKITARSGDYVDMLVIPSSGAEGDFVSYSVARGKSGLWHVRVEANGYEPWVREIVWLQKRGVFCKRTEEQAFKVELQPLSES